MAVLVRQPLLPGAATGTIPEAYGYDAYLGDLGSQYQEMLAAVQSQREAQLSRIQAQYDAAVAQMERQRPQLQQNYENSAKQAYIQNMLSKRDLPQQLAAQGLNGGMSESSQLALEADYGNQLADARKQYDQNLYDLDTQISKVRASGADALAGAEGDYNTMLADLRNNYLSTVANTKLQAQLAALEDQKYQEQLKYQKEQDAIANALNRDQFEWEKKYQQGLLTAKGVGTGGTGGTGGGTTGGGTGGSTFHLGDDSDSDFTLYGQGTKSVGKTRPKKTLGKVIKGDKRYTTIA